jgi:hypothetical protein
MSYPARAPARRAGIGGKANVAARRRRHRPLQTFGGTEAAA